MLLIGFKTQSTGVGHTEDNYTSVSSQRMEIIAGSPSHTAEDLANLYNRMVYDGEVSKEKLGKLEDEL